MADPAENRGLRRLHGEMIRQVRTGRQDRSTSEATESRVLKPKGHSRHLAGFLACKLRQETWCWLLYLPPFLLTAKQLIRHCSSSQNSYKTVEQSPFFRQRSSWTITNHSLGIGGFWSCVYTFDLMDQLKISPHFSEPSLSEDSSDCF